MAVMGFNEIARDITIRMAPRELSLKAHAEFTLWQLRDLLERMENMGKLTGTQHAEVMSVMGMLWMNLAEEE